MRLPRWIRERLYKSTLVRAFMRAYAEQRVKDSGER
jgi:hypothetical protein